MVFASTPFKKFQKKMIVDLVEIQVFWYNFVVPINYISTTLGPVAIFLDKTYDYNRLCGDEFKFRSTYTRTRLLAALWGTGPLGLPV